MSAFDGKTIVMPLLTTYLFFTIYRRNLIIIIIRFVLASLKLINVFYSFVVGMFRITEKREKTNKMHFIMVLNLGDS